MPDNAPAANALKIFPRNLTARADQIVRGNPANSRPESGVQNCFPGLEFDLRNIEQSFLRGLIFEYHRADGAMLVGVGPPVTEVTPEESKGRPLYLWAMYGRNQPEEDDPSLWGFRGLSGLDVWARVHDLMPGRVAVLLGPGPGFSNSVDSDTALRLLQTAYNAVSPDDKTTISITVRRDSDNIIQLVVVSQHRSDYLNADGVISPDLFPPGELTKSLCAPWVYDFRDCVCFYWSSNKPDIVDSEDGKQSFVNFLRQVKDRGPNPPQDVAEYVFKDGTLRRKLELSYEEMIEGWWEKLPIVLNDRESTSFSVSPTPSLTEHLTRSEVIAELSYLATVEHALIVEYLFAVYSTTAPRLAPDYADAKTLVIIAASQEVFRVAIDEMRHFRWVNEALGILGAPPSVDRAKTIGQPPQPGSGRKMILNRKYIDRPFALNPLSRATQDWFIRVEAPSQTANQDLDGMYVAILESINFQPDLFPERSRVLPLIKLIIDEGQGHYSRFHTVKQSLASFPESDYLRVLSPVPPTPQQLKLLAVCDAYYHSIEEVVQITFSLGDQSGGLLLKAAVRSMESLHEASHLLASQGVMPQFNRPATPPSLKRLLPTDSVNMLKTREAKIQNSLNNLESTGSKDEKALALTHLARTAALYQQLQEIVRRDQPQP